MDNLYIKVGDRGLFKFKPPLDNIIPNVNLQIRSISTIKGMISDGYNIYKLVYEKLGITEAEYRKDLDNDILIIGLIDDNMNSYYVPSSYLITTPDISGHYYARKGIAIKLDLMPVSESIDYLLDSIKDLIKKELGIKATVKEIALGKKTLLSEDEAIAITKLRDSIKKYSLTDKAIISEQDRLINNLKYKIKLLISRLSKYEKL